MEGDRAIVSKRKKGSDSAGREKWIEVGAGETEAQKKNVFMSSLPSILLPILCFGSMDFFQKYSLAKYMWSEVGPL